jgi:hypothetical protein
MNTTISASISGKTGIIFFNTYQTIENLKLVIHIWNYYLS